MDIKNFGIYPKDINLFVRMQSKVRKLILTQFFSSEIYKNSILSCKLFYKYSNYCLTSY